MKMITIPQDLSIIHVESSAAYPVPSLPSTSLLTWHAGSNLGDDAEHSNSHLPATPYRGLINGTQ